MPSSHLILCHPLLLLPPIPPSIRVFSNESTLCMRWPKYWSFSFSISSCNKRPGFISFRVDCLYFLAVQRTFKSLLQHHSSKASVLQCSTESLKVNLLSCVRLVTTPWTVAHQAPPSMGFSRQEYWSGLPFPSPGDLPDPGIEPRSPTSQADALTSEPDLFFV